jgi:hypothetical protein
MYKLVAGRMWSHSVRLACVIGSVAIALTAPAAGGAAVAIPYSLKVSALTGPQGGLLRIEIDAEAPASTVERLKFVQVSVNGETIRVLKDVAAPAGIAEIDLGPVPRGATVSATVLVRNGTTGQVFQLRRATVARLRPDLVVAAVHAPPQTLTTRSIDVVADVFELNGDVGATATLTLMLGPTPLAEPKTVTVPKGGGISSTFTDVKLETAMSAELTVLIGGAEPFETDTTNNSRSRTIEVTEHELVRSNVLVQALGGYGAQFNNHVYAPITPWPADTGYGDFEDKVKALEPQLVRIFYNDNWDGNWDNTHPEWPQNYASLVEVARLAQEAGATIDISFQNLGSARTVPEPSMAKFADVLEDLVRVHGLTNIRWAEVGNEPNSPTGAVTLEQYDALYRALNAQLVARGLREQIHLMGGGLIESSGSRNHYVWMKWIAANMSDVVDAYAEHIYWWYDRPGRLEYRLRDTYNLMTKELPKEQQKPTYMMEFGMRGFNTCGTKPAFTNLYYLDADCTEIWRTNISGFQQLWFNIESAQLGAAGTAKWDAYWGRYDKSSANNQLYWTIGPPTEGSPLTPSYHSMALLFRTTAPGWQVIGVAPWESNDWTVPATGVTGGETSNDQAEKELVGYSGTNGELTIVGLDTHGRDLNAASTEPPASYSIGGLPANTAFNLALWNATGNGENSLADAVTTDAAGVARFEVPLQAAFSLTTVTVS